MFFHQLAAHGNRLAIIEGDRQLSYAELSKEVVGFGNRLPSNRSLVFLQAGNDLDTLVAYLACLVYGHPMLLVDKGLADPMQAALISRYDPNLMIRDGVLTRLHDRTLSLAEGLALLLSTSGSTGSPKQVALSSTNLHANARSIFEALPMRVSDRAITTLPFCYSYGLSVINSHLLAGACIVLNEDTVVSRSFWQRFSYHGVSSLAGVPFGYEILLRLNLTQMELPSLRYLTQAGGKLPEEQVRQIAEWATKTNRRFFVMYGQTEATARMAVNALPYLKPGAIGKAIPGGEFQLIDIEGKAVSREHEAGELVYRGPNVMLGYADSFQDLGDFSPDLWLHTGDLAWFDDDGDYYISGRLKRMIKLFGQRVGLDDVERLLSAEGIRACAVGSDRILDVAFVPRATGNDWSPRDWLAKALGLPSSAIRTQAVTSLPACPNGKPDYSAVERLFDE